MKQQTLGTQEEEAKPLFPFLWGYGAITKLSRAEKKHKHRYCAICGKDKELFYERLSGGVKSIICEDCARDYVRKAGKVLEKYEEGKQTSPIFSV